MYAKRHTPETWDGRCQRCGQRSTVHTMSRFNTDLICPACENEERKHPEYRKAAAVEFAAIQKGDYNFPGIGLPPDLEKSDKPFSF